jgi:hypothetical protein
MWECDKMPMCQFANVLMVFALADWVIGELLNCSMAQWLNNVFIKRIPVER